MVSLTSASNALKNVYLGVVANQLNTNANPLLSKIEQSTSDVWGKQIIKLAPYGINGGIGAGTETGSLPNAAENQYVQFVTDLKNLYGKISISDKAMRASANNAGAFVNLLNAEMEGLVKASSFNFGRMLYGDGSGLLATVTAFSSSDGAITVDSVRNLIEGMVVDIYNSATKVPASSGHRISYVDRANNKFYLDTVVSGLTVAKDYTVFVQNSKGLEITGLGAIFGTGTSLYGLTKANYPWLTPYKDSTTKEISDATIQAGLDSLEEIGGTSANFITCSRDVRKAYQTYLSYYKRNIDVMDLAGGYKAITYNGIPVYADRFVKKDEMYLLNTDEFTLHQLCDWKWLEGDDGKVIKQNANEATYSATLVKYADLICNKPNAQGKISGISSTVTNPFASTTTTDATA
ncbi:MAG: phage major capsid protein [Firmicutes bacterium]|nr:phage major capsid protein [Bacillota bacterium]MDY3659174.1 phage major capsid protein [Eubacteriales bacterium]